MRDRRYSLVLGAVLTATASCRDSAAPVRELGVSAMLEHTTTENRDPPATDERQPGVAISARRFELRSPSPATIIAIAVGHGDLVREGDVLAILDGSDAKAELSIAESELRALVRERSSALLQAKVVRRRRAVVESLHRDGFAPAETVESAELDVDHAAADVERIDARIVALQARIARLRALVEERQLRSPMTGVVADRSVDAGAFVTTSTAILRLVSEHADVVRFAIAPEARSAWARGQRLEVRSTTFTRLTGAIVQSVAPEVDPAANQLFVDATLDDRETLPIGLAVWVLPEGSDQ
jgi:multidrug efflux pump subunit AcrA (membrane-fusion protein)